jgi:hypothetical protein
VPKPADPVKAMGVVLAALQPLDEADRNWVLQSVASKLRLTLPQEGGGAGTGAGGQQRRQGAPDAASFLRDKKPATDQQRVAVLAYYLTHHKNTPAFKKADIEAMNTEARGGGFNFDDALGNASKSSTNYLSAIGGGKKQLTAFGDQIVEALPAQEAVREVERSEKAAKRRKKARAKKKS